MPFVEIIRPVNVGIVFVSVLVGGWVGHPIVFSLPLILAALAAAFSAAFGNVINDYYDIEADRISHPHRPLPSGRVTKNLALAFAILLGISSLVIAFCVSLAIGGVVALALAMLFLYPFKVKNTFLSNSLVALLCSLAFLAGGVVTRNSLAVFPGAFAFFFHYAREIVKDVLDLQGDRTSKRRSLALTVGPDRALKFAANGLVILVLLLPLPVLLGRFHVRYLIAAAVTVVPVVLFILFKLLSHPDMKTLNLVSRLLKIGMAAGLGALCLV